MAKLQKVIREEIRIKNVILSPTGHGKPYSSLRLVAETAGGKETGKEVRYKEK